MITEKMAACKFSQNTLLTLNGKYWRGGGDTTNKSTPCPMSIFSKTSLRIAGKMEIFQFFSNRGFKVHHSANMYPISIEFSQNVAIDKRRIK